MIPEPLHPAVVHFPVVLAVTLPLVILVALWMRRRPESRAWMWVVLTAFVLAATTWFALETGEREEERVEHVVAESRLERHEEAAETFLSLVAATLIVALLGLAPGRVGSAARGVTVAASLIVLVAGWRVGHSGGELVYREGAATAYIATPCVSLYSE